LVYEGSTHVGSTNAVSYKVGDCERGVSGKGIRLVSSDEQNKIFIDILRKSGVRELSSTEVSTIYHSLIEESDVKKVENLSFVKDVYSFKVK